MRSESSLIAAPSPPLTPAVWPSPVNATTPYLPIGTADGEILWRYSKALSLRDQLEFDLEDTQISGEACRARKCAR